MPHRLLLAVLGGLVLLPAFASAQDRALQQCATIPTDPTRRHCNIVVEAMAIAQPRIGLALAGGNPVPGASSTLGMRLGSVPRIGLAGRVSALKLELPPIDQPNSSSTIDATITSVNVDATVGIFGGWSLFPTVGGFASLDLLGSYGHLSLPEDQGFNGGVSSWALGARIGILRESFTAPGLSMTATYRAFSDVEYGDRGSLTRRSHFQLSDPHMLSLRGVVGKRLLFLGTMAGVGYDKLTADAEFGVVSSGPLPQASDFRESGFETSRTTVFGSLQWTLLVLSIIGEGGWQSGGDAFSAPLPAGRSSTTQKSTYFGSIALRLSI